MRGCWWGAGRGLGSKVLEGKARAEQPDRPAASTRVIAEPLCSIQSRCKGLVCSLFIHPPPPPLSSMELGSLLPVSLRFSSLSSTWHTPPGLSLSPFPSPHLLPLPPHPPYHTSFAPDNTSASAPIHKLCHHDAHRWQLPVVLPSDWWRDFQTENSWWGMMYRRAFALSFSGLSC